MSTSLAPSTMAAEVADGLRECLPDTPLHVMFAKAVTKGATLFHVGRNGTGPNTKYWDRHQVDGVLQNGDLLPVGAREMMRVLALTPPLAVTVPGERLLYSLRAALDGDLQVMVQAVLDTETTWWHVGYSHALERLVAQRFDSPEPPPASAVLRRP